MRGCYEGWDMGGICVVWVRSLCTYHHRQRALPSLVLLLLEDDEEEDEEGEEEEDPMEGRS